MLHKKAVVILPFIITALFYTHTTYASSNFTDANNDGVVNALDVQLCVNAFLADENSPDINADGSVDSLDVQLIVNAFFGLYVDKPTNLHATAVSSSQINLTWEDNATNEEGFKIERADASNGPWSEIGAVGENVSTYSNTGLSASTRYYYRVYAHSDTIHSDTTNIADATTPGDGGSSGDHVWSQRFGGPYTDKGQSVAVNPQNGNCAITGQFGGAVDFGGGFLPATGVVNMMVATYSANGTPLWSRYADGTTNGKSVAIDQNNGAVAVTGSFNGTVQFGSQSYTSAGMSDCFVAKYNSSGALEWVDQFGDYVTDRGFGIVFDSNSNIIVTGLYQNPDTIFITKYSPNGEVLWTNEFTGSGTNIGQAVAVDIHDNIALVGNFYGTVDFGGGPLTAASAWSPDVVVAKYSPNGSHLWSKRFGDQDEDFANDVAIDNNGDIVLIGGFLGTISFGGTVLTNNGNYDLYLAKLNGEDGTHQWSQQFGANGNEGGKGVTVDLNGDILLTGNFSTTLDFGGEALTSTGSLDIFIAKFSTSGAHIWSKGFGGTGADYGNSISVDVSGKSYITGTCSGTVDFGGGPLTSVNYSYDVFLLHLD